MQQQKGSESISSLMFRNLCVCKVKNTGKKPQTQDFLFPGTLTEIVHLKGKAISVILSIQVAQNCHFSLQNIDNCSIKPSHTKY